MRNDICTIPVNEIFEKNDGCPICRMYAEVEDHILGYIMGAAMMEPDVRIVTNKEGFCPAHFDKMMARRGRLQLALILESHLAEVKSGAIRSEKEIEKLENSCFVCEKIEWGMSRMIDTVYRSYETDRDFRTLFDGQSCFCMPHYRRLLSGCDKKKMRSWHGEFEKSLKNTVSEYLSDLCGDMTKYCSMYDYRNNGTGADWGNSRDAVERAVNFLSGRRVE